MYESVVRRRRVGLDLLRSLAIGGVVVSHGMQFLYAHVPLGFWLGHLGSFGVDLFFVLSGFLIGGILIRLGPGLAEGRVVLGFWVRRWLRIIPNYYYYFFLIFCVLSLCFLRFLFGLISFFFLRKFSLFSFLVP